MNDTLNKIVADMRHEAELAASGGVCPDLSAMLAGYADRIERASAWIMNLTLKYRFQSARSCIQDARLVATEREYDGIAALADHALGDLDAIGKTAGLAEDEEKEGAE